VVKRYLNLITLGEALDLVRISFPEKISSSLIPLEESVGRITARPIFAQYSVPEVHLAAMDGIAAKSRDTHGAGEQSPVTLTDAVRINTGNVIPEEYDTVIMIEDVTVSEGGYIIRKAAPPWQHVRPAGEDIGESEMALPSMHRIRPHEAGALATYGITEVDTISVRVGLIPTGSELVAHGTHPRPGQVVESNTIMAEAWLTSVGATCRRYPITPDEPDRIREAIRLGVRENDILIVSAGSSAGTKDFTENIIGELGEVLSHGVSIKPGKPVIIGKIDGKPVIGLPGYPLSALTVIRELIIPLLGRFGIVTRPAEHLEARLTSTLHSDAGIDEFVLLAVGKVGDRYVASPLSRGAGVQMSAVRANALLKIPLNLEGYESGQAVPATLMVPREQVDSALLVTGSHDPCLDYLADLMQIRGIEVHSTNVGSMGGLLALKKGDCHAAPMHLLCGDGTYNTCYLEKYLGGEELSLLCVAEREQGIISRDGSGLQHILGKRFINRQKGSGTRLLLDFELAQRGISPERLPGYEREVTTHLAVALAIKSGEADAGLGVYSVAKSLGLSFVPVGKERYEMVTYTKNLDDPRIEALFTTVGSARFREVLKSLGGYDLTGTGNMRQLP